ncbi:Importin alpha subunit (Karyopherin alpha subunit) (Serine-rich RNA polymerase I suppressor protein) [Tulasnella sp. 417]|nr:Importin alpha subunit (Karyopherin alpha subunit) (Serine-rich RNA polymerase I suppressor protein) [Tulasnella sp. 417]
MGSKTEDAEDAAMETVENRSDRDDGDEEEKIDESVLDGYLTDDKRIAPHIVEGLRSNDRTARLEAATKLHQLADHREAIAIQSIFDSDLHGTIVEMISSDHLELQAQVMGLLPIITNGDLDQTSAVVEAGAIPKLVDLASSTKSDDIRDGVLLALGNIGATSQELRTKVLQEGGLKSPLDILADPSAYAKTNRYWAVNAINCYTHPSGGRLPEYEVTEQMISVLSKYVLYQKDEAAESLQDSLLSLSRLLVDEVSVDKARGTDLIPRLVHLCTSKETETRHNAQVCVGQIVLRSVDGTEDLINAGILDTFKTCIVSEDGRDRKETCFAASNLVVGTLKHAKALMELGLVPPLVKILLDQGDTSGARNDAAWTLSSLVANWGQDHYEILDTLFKENSLEAFCSALSLTDYDCVEVALKGILVLVKTQWDGRHRAVERVKAGDGIKQLRAVRYRNDIYRTELHNMAQDILKTYFPEFSQPARV